MQRIQQVLQLAAAFKVGRDETMKGMGLHRVAQLNDIEAAGGVGSFCQLLNTDVEDLQKAYLDMLANLIALENSAGNELAAGEAFAQSGASDQLVRVMGNRTLELQRGESLRPEVERKALRLIFHICKARTCQNALRYAGAGTRLREMLAVDSPAPMETRVEAARCLKKYVDKNMDNIVELVEHQGITLLCNLLKDFLTLRSNSLEERHTPMDESFHVAIEAILSTICECLHISELSLPYGTQVVQQILAHDIESFVTILQRGDRVNRILTSQILIRASQDPVLVVTIAEEQSLLKELLRMLDSRDDCSMASEILCSLCTTQGKTIVSGNEVDVHEQLLHAVNELNGLDLVLKKLDGCVIGPGQFAGEINFQQNLLGITKAFSAQSKEYVETICSKGSVATLSAFLLSRKSSLIPLCAQTLLNLCEVNAEIVSELYDANTCDFFQRMLQTPPDDNRISALRYFEILIENDHVFPVNVIDKMFLMVSGVGRNVLRNKSIHSIAKLSGVTDIVSMLDPIPEPLNPERAALVAVMRERIVSTTYFPVLLDVISSSIDIELRTDVIKCIRCALNGSSEMADRMIDQELLRIVSTLLRRFAVGGLSAPSSDPEGQINSAMLQILYLVLKSSIAHVLQAPGDQVMAVVKAATDCINSGAGDTFALWMDIVQLFLDQQEWKDCFVALYMMESPTVGMEFVQMLMANIEKMGSSGKPIDATFDSCFVVLKKLVQEVSSSSVANCMISAGVHITLLELLPSNDVHVVVQSLGLLDLLTESRPVRMLILEAGESLKSLVDLYQSSSENLDVSEPEKHEVAFQAGHILVHLSGDPLEFRKLVYDHRDILPVSVLRNIFSPVDEIAHVAEDIVASLVDTDFATCPLWMSMIEEANAQFAFQIIVKSKRQSIRSVSTLKLRDILLSHPEKLEEGSSNGLSAQDRNVLVNTLIDFLVAVDPRTSVVGLLTLGLLVTNGQVFDDKQGNRVAVDCATSLMYWSQKGTERHRQHVVDILHDGIADDQTRIHFYEELCSMPEHKDNAFIREFGTQILEMDASTKVDGILKRCALLQGFLSSFAAHSRTLSVAVLDETSQGCFEVLEQVAVCLVKLFHNDQRVSANVAQSVFQFLIALTAWDTLRLKLVKLGVIECIVTFLDDSLTTTEASDEARYFGQRLLKILGVFDIAGLISAKGAGALIDLLDSSRATARDTLEVVELLTSIADDSHDGNSVITETKSVFPVLVRVLGRALDDISSQTANNEVEDCEQLDVACAICLLVFRLSNIRASREIILLETELFDPVLSVLEWLPSVFGETWSALVPDPVSLFQSVMDPGLMFLECACVLIEGMPESGAHEEYWKRMQAAYLGTLDSFYDGHHLDQLFISACEGLVCLYQNPMASRAVEVDTLWERVCQHCTRATEDDSSSANCLPVECKLAMVDLISLVDALTPAHDQLWVVDMAVHSSVSAAHEPADLASLFTLWTKICANYSLREYLVKHTDYALMVEGFEHLLDQPAGRPYRTRILKLLMLLGESLHKTSDHRQPVVPFDLLRRGEVSLSVSSSSSSGSTHHCEATDDQTNGAEPSDTNGSPASGPAIDSDANRWVDSAPMPAPSEHGSAASSESPTISCGNCGTNLYIPPGVDPSDLTCPNCLHALQVVQRFRPSSVSPKHGPSSESSEPHPFEQPPPPAVTSPRAHPTVDVRDTKMVSCEHCGKHLIVKSKANAVKCPSCEGVFKLSTKTST